MVRRFSLRTCASHAHARSRADVRKYVIKRVIKKEGKKDKVRAPKIQRLITPQRLQRKRALYVAVVIYLAHPVPIMCGVQEG